MTADDAPIPEGHKLCKKCGIIRPVSDFYKRKGTRDGLHTECRHCNAYRVHKNYTEHKEERNVAHSFYYATHKEEWTKYKSQQSYRVWATRTINCHRRRGIIVKTTIDELEELAKKSTHCPLCGCELDWRIREKGKVMPNSPTWDRMYNLKTMRLQDTLIICHRCNTKKSTTPWPEYIRDNQIVVRNDLLLSSRKA